MKSLRDLLDDHEPAWPLVKEWISQAKCPVEILPASDPQRAEALVATQVTTRSPMGAVIYETGGLLVDHGWLRVLGSGHLRLPRSLPEWNRHCTGFGSEPPPGLFLIADDVIGGLFAIDGGALGIGQEQVGYFAPDSLKWEGTSLKYSGFIDWCLSGKLGEYYKDYRWTGWEKDLKSLPGDRGYSIAPPPIFKGVPFIERNRKAILMKELYGFYQDLAKQIADAPDGSEIILRVKGKESAGNEGRTA
jgi:hypothetical protein